MSIVKIQKLREEAVIPTRGSEKAAGYDLHAAIPEAVYILPHSTTKIKTGLAMELPDNTFGAIFARSGLATKQGLRPAICVGVCDSDYRGEYIVAVHNDTDIVQVVCPGEKIAQLILLPFLPIDFQMVDKLSETERGEGGFGSTGL